MIDRLILGCAGIGLIACSSPQEMGESVGVDPSQVAVASQEGALETLERRTAGGTQATLFEDSQNRGDASRDFSYQWPSEVSAIPGLEAYLTNERDDALAGQKEEWEEAVAEFGTEGCLTCTARSYGKGWETVADTPRFLSLIGGVSVYTGGAHPNSYFDALIWDRKAPGGGAVMQPVALFTSEAAFEEAVRKPYCEGLAVERGDRVGSEMVDGVDPLTDCPKVEELTIALRSSNGQTLDTIDLLAAPYVAGSYAEGPYEVTLPVTDAVMAVVKPEYREDFSAQ